MSQTVQDRVQPLDVPLRHEFADAVPEMAVPWRAEAAPDPRLLLLNEPLAAELGLDAGDLRSSAGLGLLTGTLPPATAHPVAQAYAGHQFGGFNPGLGDGRALLLGELTDAAGRTRDLHLKGSGRTRFARAGDGLASVGPMLREYVVSEAVHALGIPSTRALAVVGTGRGVQRETVLPGAVLTRVAASHLRVGSFQWARMQDDPDLLRRLADLAIARHHPEAGDAEQPYRALFEAVVAAQASLVAQWMLVGFVHGVLNTDNVTISGEAIDFGPCAFVDAHDLEAVYSSIDEGGRYRFGYQPAITEWNLARLAETLLPLIDDDQETAVAEAVESLGSFRAAYGAAWTAGIGRKLGLPDGLDPEVVRLLGEDLQTLMGAEKVDHTGFWRALSTTARSGGSGGARDLVLDLPGFDAWAERWLALAPDADAMDRVNPVYVPRNHLVEEALTAGIDGALGPLHDLLDAVTRPFEERAGLERYAEPAPESFGDYTTYCGT